MAITVNDKNLGHATAYGYAVSKGYTGTEEEYAELMASYATVAEEAAQSATEAAASATEAERQAGLASGSASDASASATAANGYKSDVQSAANTFTNTTVPAAVQSVTSEGTTQIGLVQTEGTTQIGAVEAKGEEIIESLPQDYTEVLADIGDLKSAVSQEAENNNGEFAEVESRLYTSESLSLSFSKGGLNPSTGDVKTDNTKIRTGFIRIIPSQIIRIKVEKGAKVKVFYYSTDSYTNFQYVDSGWWDGSKIVKNDTLSNFYIKILAKYPDDRTVETVSDLSNNISADKMMVVEFASESYVDNVIYRTRQDTDFLLSGRGYYWNTESDKAVYTQLSNSNWMASSPISVEEGDLYTVSGDQGGTHKTRIWILTDDELNIVTMAEDHYATTETIATETFTVPTGATKLLLCTRYDVGSPYVWLYKKETALDILDTVNYPLKDKKLSLLGDSISAYTGTIPIGNTAYYTGSNSGVTSADQMWWKILCDKTGMTPLVINGWSGSGINWQTESSHSNIVPMSDDSRCGGLHDGSTNPDVIIIAGGLNDYTYAQMAQNEPLDWDGKTTPGYTEPSAGKIVYNSFTEAYVATIKKLQTNYPNAIIVAVSTWFTMRGTDNGYTLTHTVGQNVYTQQDYNDKIRYVAEQMHVPYIDVSNIGINRNNFYPTYAVDSDTIPTHPNAKGQALMGKAIAAKLIDLVSGFLT